MDDQLEKWIAQLNGDDIAAAIEAAEVLRQTGGEFAQNALKSRFEPHSFMRANTDEQNRLFFTIALTLAEMGSYHEYRYVVDEDAPFVRTRVKDMLERIGKARAVKAAIAMLSSSNADERYWAAAILYVLPDRLASDALVRAQEGETYEGARLVMLHALGGSGDIDAILVLEALIDHPDTEIQRVARLSLDNLRKALLE